MKDCNQQLLHQLLIERTVDENMLLEKLNMTKRQLTYSIQQINDQLEELGIPKIQKKEGIYVYSNKLMDYILTESSLRSFVFSTENRTQIILLMILIKEDYLALDYFTYVLNVSKNTILADMKKCKDYATTNNLSIEYSRKDGYYLVGSEWDKRIILGNVIYDLYQQFGKELIYQLIADFKDNVKDVENSIAQIEKFLGVKYTDEDFYLLIFFIAMVLRRIGQGKLIDNFDLTDMREIENTKEFQSLIFSTSFPKIPESEYLYISLHLLGSKTRNERPLTQKDLPELANSLWEFLNEFEANTLFVLSDKKGLLEKLLNHFKPAYYRIKYNLSFENVLYDKIVTKYSILHNFIKQSFKPVEQFFGTRISDKEIAYVTLFIGGHLLEKGSSDFEEKIVKAVILCPNGISMSKIIESEIKTLFPEFLFYPPISIRDYQGFVLPHDLVFSTVPIEANQDVYVVTGLSSEKEKLDLRRRVISNFFRLDFDTLNANDILSVVKKYADVKQEKKLVEELNGLLLKGKNIAKHDEVNEESASLLNVLDPECIQVIEGTKSWEDILERACNPLVAKEVIQENYSNYLWAEYKEKPSYIMLDQRILLPHLDPKIVSQELGISILVLKEGVFYNGKTMYVVVLLTTPDKISHLNVLLDIRKMSRDEGFINRLKGVMNREEALETVVDFLKQE